MRALPYFVNNLAPGLRSFWIHYLDRVRVEEFMRNDLARLGPDDAVPSAAPDSPTPRAVVLAASVMLRHVTDDPVRAVTLAWRALPAPLHRRQPSPHLDVPARSIG